MRVLELPKPLIPLNPLVSPQQPRIPRALGQVFVGKPFLKLPEVQAPQVQQAPASLKKSDENPAKTVSSEANGPLPEWPTYGGAGKAAGNGAAALGQSLDVKA